jgi:flagellar basal-body rod protein FlgG
MVAARTKQELIASNIANIETPGFKKQAVTDEVFSQMLLLSQVGASSRGLGEAKVKSGLSAPVTDFSQGQVVESSSPYHVAIHGNGFFGVMGEEGPRFTRAGNFTLDGAGFLTDPYGNRLLLSNWQPLQTGGQKLRITEDGTVYLGETPRGRLMIMDFADSSQLQRDINGQFLDEGGEGFPISSRVLQGYLERANVDVGEELVQMLLVNRIFESAQHVVSTYDQVLDKAKEIGSVR